MSVCHFCEAYEAHSRAQQFCDKNPKKWVKTGRHFPIEDLLGQMEEPKDG